MDCVFHTDMQKDTVIHAFYSVLLDETYSNIPVAVRGIESVVVNGTELGLGGYLDIGLYDTMEDLFVNFLGALVFSVIAISAPAARPHGAITEGFVPRLREETPAESGTPDAERAEL